ncbi:hypothetical protein ZWY2020_047344, partial [Hordeum vulgare]
KKKRDGNKASLERLTLLIKGFTEYQKKAAREMGMHALMDIICPNLVNPICDWLGEIYHYCNSEICCLAFCRHRHMVKKRDNGIKNYDSYQNKFQNACVVHISLAGSDGEAVARYLTSFVGERTHRRTGSRGWYDYNSSHEPSYTQQELFQGWFWWRGRCGRATKQKQVAMPSRASVRLKKAASTAASITSTRSSPRVSSSNTGDPIVLEDLRKTARSCAIMPAKPQTKGPLEHIHSKLVTSDNPEIHMSRVDKVVVVSPTVAASFDARKSPSPPVADVHTTTRGISRSGSDEPVSTRTIEVVCALMSMRDAVTIPCSCSTSDGVDAPEQNLNKGDSHPYPIDFMRRTVGTIVAMKEGVAPKIPDQMTYTDDSFHIVASSALSTQVAPATSLQASLPPRCNPHKNPALSSSAAELGKSKAETGFVFCSILFPPFAQSKAAEIMKHATTDGVARTQQTAPFMAEKTPALYLHISKLPINIGVPYSVNNNIAKKVMIENPNNTPCPTKKHDVCEAHKSDMFVQLSPLDSQERHPMEFTPPSCNLGIDCCHAEQAIDPMFVAFDFPAGTATMMTQPDVDGWKVVKFAELVLQGSPEKISSSLDEYYRRIDEDAIKRRLLRNQGQPSFGSLDVLVYDDVYRSLTHGSVRHASLVRPPSADDFQPEFRAARERSILYAVVRHFENVTSNTKHMKELRD